MTCKVLKFRIYPTITLAFAAFKGKAQDTDVTCLKDDSVCRTLAVLAHCGGVHYEQGCFPPTGGETAVYTL